MYAKAEIHHVQITCNTFTFNENFKRETPHFLSINGKNENIKLRDILHIANEYSINNPNKIINEINQSLLQWNRIAEDLNIPIRTRDYIALKMKTFPYKITTANWVDGSARVN